MKIVNWAGLALFCMLGCSSVDDKTPSPHQPVTGENQLDTIFSDQTPMELSTDGALSGAGPVSIEPAAFPGSGANAAPVESVTGSPRENPRIVQLRPTKTESPPPAPLPVSTTPLTIEQELADVVRSLDGYEGRDFESLQFFEKHALFKLQKRGVLLLMLTGRDNGEACRKILNSLERFALASNLELEGLKFSLYQNFAKVNKRNGALTFIMKKLKKNMGGRFKLEEVRFCKKVLAFRQYLNVPEPVSFAPGQQVTIYCEFIGADSMIRPNSQDREQQIEVYLQLLNDKEQIVDIIPFLKREHGTRILKPDDFYNDRSYINGVYNIPDSLRPGKYRIKLSATDLVSKDVAYAFLDFDIHQAGR